MPCGKFSFVHPQQSRLIKLTPSIQALKEVFFHELSSPTGSPRLHTFSISKEHVEFAAARHEDTSSSFEIRSRPTMVSRRRGSAAGLVSQSPNSNLQVASPNYATPASWDTIIVPGPDLTDKATVVNLGKMCSDAYMFGPNDPDWQNTTLGFNNSGSFGFEDGGLRGHIFGDERNETIIVAFKGTTVGEKAGESNSFNMCSHRQIPEAAGRTAIGSTTTCCSPAAVRPNDPIRSGTAASVTAGLATISVTRPV